MINLPEGLKSYLRTPFVAIVWVMDTYAHNRARLKTFMAQPRTAQVFSVAVVLTFVVWLGVALMANEEHGQRLTDAIQGLLNNYTDGSSQ